MCLTDAVADDHRTIQRFEVLFPLLCDGSIRENARTAAMSFLSKASPQPAPAFTAYSGCVHGNKKRRIMMSKKKEQVRTLEFNAIMGEFVLPDSVRILSYFSILLFRTHHQIILTTRGNCFFVFGRQIHIGFL